MIEMRWVKGCFDLQDNGDGTLTLKNKLQYRTWKSEAPSAGSWTIERVWTEWMDVPTVELEAKK